MHSGVLRRGSPGPHPERTIHGRRARLRGGRRREPSHSGRDLGNRRGNLVRGDHSARGRTGGPRAGSGSHRNVSRRTQIERRSTGSRSTTPGRTLIDLADVVPRRRASSGPSTRPSTSASTVAGLRPCSDAEGAALIADVLAGPRAGSTTTRSELEEVFLALCAARLPAPEVKSGSRATRSTSSGAPTGWSWRSMATRPTAHAPRSTRSRRDADLMVAGYRVFGSPGRRERLRMGGRNGASLLAR